MRTSRNRFLGLCAIAVLTAAGLGAHAASGNGPYYATPSWDQKLDGATTRFMVLLNWRSEAVLDRETGLVWERVPQRFDDATLGGTQANTWDRARNHCISKNVGGRRGWRLPAIAELASLMEPDLGDLFPGGAFPPGHPFDTTEAATQVARFWSATTVSGATGAAYVVSFRRNEVTTRDKVDFADRMMTWCVRGGSSTDQY